MHKASGHKKLTCPFGDPFLFLGGFEGRNAHAQFLPDA
jgi:hypothetical protein